MSETKALDGLVNEKNWHDGIGGALIFAATVLGDGWLDQAADELAILKEKESDNRKGWDDCYEVNTHLRAELDDMKRCYDRDANCECDQGVPTIIKLRAELDEARKAIQEALNELTHPSEPCDISATYILETAIRRLKAHPE